MPEIQNHVWYKKDLPPGVSDMNDNLPPPGAGLQVSFSPSLAHSLRLLHALACSLVDPQTLMRLPLNQDRFTQLQLL